MCTVVREGRSVNDFGKFSVVGKNSFLECLPAVSPAVDGILAARLFFVDYFQLRAVGRTVDDPAIDRAGFVKGARVQL